MTMKSKLIGILILIVVLAGAGLYGWWWFDGRWRPKTVDKHQAEIAAVLEKSGWVSPGGNGPKVYMVAYRSCPDCIRYWDQDLPKLLKAGVEPRVILVARPDLNGQHRSTPAERATVAELWLNRDWGLFDRWRAVDPAAWTAPGIHPADGDVAREAVVAQSRQFIETLRPLLADNGVKVGDEGVRYPTMIWWDKAGVMKACDCEDPSTYRHVRRDVGA